MLLLLQLFKTSHLQVFLYNLFLLLFKAGTYIVSLFNTKAKKWVQGRKHIFKRLKEAIPSSEKIIWIHCASLGEFEQGKPLMERFKAQYPGFKILLTFFSPSGYEAQKDYKGADWVFYLPLDGPFNAKRFLEIAHPSLVIFVKYEFWYYYLKKIKYRSIPLILVSALFRKDMSFFKWYGGLQRKMLSRFDHLFVQNEASKKLVDGVGLAGICSVSGDTRFDRVIEIAGKFEPIPEIEKFISGSRVIVAGSTWPEDEQVLQKAFAIRNDASLKLIIAPHEVSEKGLTALTKLFPDSIRYSSLMAPDSRPSSCLIIDNIGMLSRLYRYGYITYVGGGMTSYGVHNVLEAAVYSRPVIMGPHYQKYIEAIGLVECGGATVIKDETDLAKTISKLLDNWDDCYKKSSEASGKYVQLHAGATQKILQVIQEKRLLTN